MKEASKYIHADKILRWSILFSALLLLLHLLILGIAYIFLPPIVPAYNQLPWGDARIGTKAELFIPIVISFICFFINYYLIGKIYNHMPLVARIISITMLLIAVLGIIFISRTVQILI